jgi:hypothetical protein
LSSYSNIANIDNPDHFSKYPYEGTNTILKGFQKSVERVGLRNFLGTRDDLEEGRPYKWRSYKEVDEITDNLVKGK